MVRPPKRIAISNAGPGSRLPSCSPLICKLKGRTDRVREPQVCEKSTLTDAHEFPVGATKVPVLRNLFPVNLIRELAPKCRGNGVSGSRAGFHRDALRLVTRHDPPRASAGYQRRGVLSGGHFGRRLASQVNVTF